jgi:transcriptional regulator with XRE-family HTH domain
VRERVKHEALAEYAEMQKAGVGALRMARKLTQVAVAEQMHVTQGVVSRLESQRDWNLSTLRKYVGALGGRLELRAVFPDDELVVDTLMEDEVAVSS